jgi:hypothetical protein
MHLSKTPGVLLRRGLTLAMAGGILAMLALTLPRDAAANDDGPGRACGSRTLRGDYGILISGIAPEGPSGKLEMTVGTALRTYDGQGNFTQVDSVHGQISGAVVDRRGSGTYEVRSDCSGTATLFLTGVPFPVVSSFVIVDGGEEVKEAVMSPPPAVVSAVQRRVRR